MGFLDNVRNKLHEANEGRKQRAAEQAEINKQFESKLALARQRERLKSADTIAKIEAQQHIQRVKTGQPSGGGIGGKVLNELKRPVTKEEMNRWSFGGGSSMGLGLSPPQPTRKGKRQKTPRKADYSSWMP